MQYCGGFNFFSVYVAECGDPNEKRFGEYCYTKTAPMEIKEANDACMDLVSINLQVQKKLHCLIL